MLRTTIKGVLHRVGALRTMARRTPQRIAILMYHGFRNADDRASAAAGDGKFTPAGLLEQQIRVCRMYGTVISLSEALSGATLPRNPIVVTIDDGYLNNWTVAFPLLQRYGVPATIFLTTGFLDEATFLWMDWFEHVVANAPSAVSHVRLGDESIAMDFRDGTARARTRSAIKERMKKEPIEEIRRFLSFVQREWGIRYERDMIPESLRPLKWDQVRAMDRSGLVEFGAHTVSHPILSRCARDLQLKEILESKRRIEEELDRPCTAFAYPNGRAGDFTSETKEIVRSCGFKAAVTTERGFAHPSPPDPLLLPRWGIPDTEFDLAYLLVR